jgi:hypothetical protein
MARDDKPPPLAPRVGVATAIEPNDQFNAVVDHLFLGTGYHPNVAEISFLDPTLRDQVHQQDGLPVLDDCFESSVPSLHFVGGLAGWSFGPICRFVAGARAAARQVARRAA